MSIIDESGQTIMRVGMIHKIMAGACVGLITAQTAALITWGAWVTSTVTQHSIDLAVMRSMRASYSDQSSDAGGIVSSECFDTSDILK